MAGFEVTTEANDERLRPFVRRKALQDLGADAYFRSDLDSALKDWTASNKIEETVGIDENLATYYADQNQWKAALDTMNRGRALLEHEESQGITTAALSDLKAQHAVQTANLLRRYARTLPHFEAVKQWELAKHELSVTLGLDRGFNIG